MYSYSDCSLKMLLRQIVTPSSQSCDVIDCRELLNITLTTKRERSERRKIFDSDGYIRDTQLKIMNLKPVSNQAAASSGGLQYSAHAKWEEVTSLL